MRIFCEFRSIFPSPAGARKNTSNEQNVRSYYMLNHRIRGLLFHYKKNYFAIGFYFFGKSIQKHPDSVCENDVNNEQNVRGYYVKPLNEKLIILLQKKEKVKNSSPKKLSADCWSTVGPQSADRLLGELFFTFTPPKIVILASIFW